MGGRGDVVSTPAAVATGRPQRLGIVHTTGFHYPGQVLASYNEARMTPLTNPLQTTLDHRIEVTPGASTFTYRDYWGTQVTAFELRVPHDHLTVTARSVVETFPGERSRAPAVSWADLAGDACRDRFAELLAPTQRTQPGEEAVALAREVVSGLAPGQAGRALAEWLPAVLDYVPGATGVHTSAAQAWDVRKGVCQDFAHVAVGILRNLGMPARYVSGYLLPRSDAEVGENLRGQSHAWVQWWSGSWQAWDPTSGRPAGPDHVLVAQGRDYDDVPPLKGIYSGAGSGKLFVTVDFTRLT
jgi:transglutaminase-like putative cysteine protease